MPLELLGYLGNIRRMNFIYAFLVLVGIALLLVAGILLAAKGSVWLLMIALALPIYGFIKHGCLSH